MKRNICGVLIDDLTKKQTLESILRRIDSGEQTVVYTPNPIMAQDAKADPEFMRILNRSDFNVPDGSGLILASRLLSTPIPERICGIELGEQLLAEAARRGLRVFFYGGERGVALLAAKRMMARYPGLTVVGAIHGFQSDDSSVREKIRLSRADLVFVCLGSPKQERWINENRRQLDGVRLLIGLGGSLDVWSGRVKRAPIPLRKSGLEWAWRMTSSPKRLSRLPKLLVFGASTVGKALSNVVTMHK